MNDRPADGAFPGLDRSKSKPARAAAWPCPVVGIGASAGGLEAFEEFLANTPPGTGLAYVLVQHLDPNHDSLLSELLARRTAMPVHQAVEGVLLEPDHVYCIPPNADLGIRSGRLHLSRFKEPRGLRRPIDTFFASLAAEQHDNAACIVLSGTGGDGTQGLRAVKEAGGLTFAQDPGTARYDGMPRSAVATGVVDHVVPVAQMPFVLVSYFRRRAGGLPPEDHPVDEAGRTFLQAICRELQAKTGHDFSSYKTSTLTRRIRRRMGVLDIAEDTAYLGRLVSDPDEAQCLLRDLLINVTAFFRDTHAFDVLAHEAVPEILRGKRTGDTIRVWVAGCSSGEEAYSIAMLLDAAVADAGLSLGISVFGTDIDEAMLAAARSALYPHTIARDLPDGFRERYFVAEEGGLRVNASLRDTVRFSMHNAIKDPPFSRLDLVSCRNMMIYFGQELQARLLPVFHYGLNDGGFMFLGQSENLGGRNDLFDVVDRTARLFRRKTGSASMPLDLSHETSGRDRTRRHSDPAQRDAARPDMREAQDRVLERYAPAHVVVDPQGGILHVAGRTAKYLELSPGAPSSNIADLARPDLRKPLRRLLGTVRKSEKPGFVRGVEVSSEFGTQTIDLVADPIARERILIVFQDAATFRLGEGEEVVDDASAEDDRLHVLEGDLREARERLRSTVEELEIANEELKTSNEEMMSMNEELQSSNEELSTVNEELKNKLDELARANNDLQNFLESTQLPVVFLDRNLKLRTFTPASTRIFNFIDQDRGRPLSDVSSRLDYDEIITDARKVLASLVPMEREVPLRGGRGAFMMNVLPYRLMDGRIDGVVLTFTDVTRLKQVESNLRASEREAHEQKEKLELLYRSAPIGMAAVDRHGAYQRVNQILADMNGPSIEDHIGRNLRDMSPEIAREADPLIEQVLRGGEALRRVELKTTSRFGEDRTFLLDVYPNGEKDGVGIILQDVTDMKRLTESQRQLMNELQHRVKNTLATVQSITRQTARGKRDVDTFAETLNHRIAALGRTHNLLTTSNWTEASLQRIIEQEIEPFAALDGMRVVMRGGPISLPPRMALALTMAMHELTTNAAKYGALSNDAGKIEIDWELTGETDVRNLRIRWRETGGPPVHDKGRSGFGRLLLEKGLAHDLAGSVDLLFETKGVVCEIGIPWQHIEGS